jgi:hypothetical protein
VLNPTRCPTWASSSCLASFRCRSDRRAGSWSGCGTQPAGAPAAARVYDLTRGFAKASRATYLAPLVAAEWAAAVDDTDRLGSTARGKAGRRGRPPADRRRAQRQHVRRESGSVATSRTPRMRQMFPISGALKAVRSAGSSRCGGMGRGCPSGRRMSCWWMSASASAARPLARRESRGAGGDLPAARAAAPGPWALYLASAAALTWQAGASPARGRPAGMITINDGAAGRRARARGTVRCSPKGVLKGSDPGLSDTSG